MRRTKALILIMLTSSFVLLMLYSMLNLQFTNSQGVAEEMQLADITNEAPVISTDTSIKENAIAEIVSQSESVMYTTTKAVQLVTFSESFINDIPKSGAYWNRKLHSFLRQLDATGNVSKLVPLNTHCQPESAESLHMNIPDFRNYPELYQNFIQGMDCRNPQILIDQPRKCASAQKVFLLFAIKSTPRHFERRQAVRETWGKERTYTGGLVVKTVFLLGTSSSDYPNLDKMVTFEAKEFGDVLVWDFQDSFYNLTLKEHVFFKWAVHRCHHVSFIFKGDDDVFANTPEILHYLHSLEPEKASNLYTGQIISEATPLRDVNIKYYVPQTFFDGAYPAYAGGGGFLFSGALLRPLHLISQYIPFFPIDDVYTGMCFKALNVFPEKHKGFQTFDIREQDRDNACVHKSLLLVHKRNAQQTVRLWRNMHSPLLTC
ncbi:N-acetyllactosaminide beta-1,3-N-acetylglucosaminyltransferase 2 [Brachyhypopomus gauderio]|uniref:N-acetyllactosaminide beta-1,3-N-acetylglucosaminyltransferase 2 n=1 Tax=Brachyhypopomus gauderio TaxID=698409 RepID=UPI00404121EE